MNTHPFNGPFSGTTRVSRYQKGKTNLDFTEARDSEWQWHLLGHMQVCISLQTDNHAIPHRSTFLRAGCPSCCPTNSVKALKALIEYTIGENILNIVYQCGIQCCDTVGVANGTCKTCSRYLHRFSVQPGLRVRRGLENWKQKLKVVISGNDSYPVTACFEKFLNERYHLDIAVCKYTAILLLELTCHTGSHRCYLPPGIGDIPSSTRYFWAYPY